MKNLSIKYIFYLALYMLAPVRMKAQHLPNEDIVYYITQYADIAINEMVRTGVPASIKIAQGILETQAGKSKLVAESNNHFGIKCKSNWDGPKVYHDDDAQGECFRKYKDAISSYKDHSDFLKLQPRYTSLFELDVDDYKGWAWGLKKAGYATNPIYAETLIKFIEDYQLNILNDYAEDEEQEKYDLSEYIGEITKNGLTPSTVTTKSSSSFSNKKISYPEDVFKINNVKVLPKLLSYNELPKSNSVLKKSELVFLQPKKSVGNKSIHRVKRNESLRDISQHEGIKLASLLQYNQLKANSKLKVGQKLNLKPKKGTSYKQPVKSSKKKKSRRK
ncbi:MAG: hypothetical protein RLZZ333_1285 [Bacteroidota bacterium]